MRPAEKSLITPVQRMRIWYTLLLVLFAVFAVRLFYLQVIRHDYYKTAALSTQLKQYEIEPQRGVIELQNGDKTVPIVLNEVRYTLFADPQLIEDAEAASLSVQTVIGGEAEEYAEKMRVPGRYSVLAKKLTKSDKQKIDELDIKGVLTREVPQRTYPQGNLAAQVLGFVDDAGKGRYGLEEFLDEELRGRTGQLRAITDAQGVPLPANKENVLKPAVNGQKVILTIDLGMQQMLENAIADGVKKAKSKSGGALIMDVKTGAVKAMANYPTYDPAKFFEVDSEDIDVFQNNIVSSPLEVGSIMKPLTMAAALDMGAVNRNTSYYDKGSFTIDGATVTNVSESGGPGQRTMPDILQQSLNTGATWLLMQMGGGEVNQTARTRWHDYMTEHYQFGKTTGIEQGYESGGTIPHPEEGFGLNIQYVNTAFGQGMTATPLQMAAAISSVVNGGTYYQPRLVDSIIDSEGVTHTQQSKIVNPNVVKSEVGKTVKEFMEHVFESNHRVYGMPQLRNEFSIGGKTGTAEIPKPEGGYYKGKFNGMFMGFVGGEQPEYVIVVRVNEPRIPGYAGSTAAGPVFVELANGLIDNFGVTPKK